MATTTILFTGSDKNPYFPADNVAGGNFTSRRGNAALFSNGWYSSTDAVWSCDVDPASNNFSAQVVFDNVDSNARGITIDGDGAGNGWIFIGNNANVRVFAMSAWALSGSPLATYSTTFATGAALNIDVTQSSGTFVVKNGSTSIGTFANTTYTSGLKAGLTSRTNGRIRSFTLTYTPSRTVDTITDPIVLGSAISVGLTGYTAPTSVTGGGMSATGLSFAANTLTATWPAISESIAPTVALPATNVTVTVAEAGGSNTITTNINLPSGFVATSFLSAINDPRYIGGNITLQDGWRAYTESFQFEVGNIEIDADGGITADNAGTFIMYLHKFGGDNTITQYNITINEAGEIVDFTQSNVTLQSGRVEAREQMAIVRTKLSYQANSVATTVADLRTDFNSLLSKMNARGWFTGGEVQTTMLKVAMQNGLIQFLNRIKKQAPDQMAVQSASVAADVAALRTDFNALLTKLKTANLMATS